MAELVTPIGFDELPNLLHPEMSPFGGTGGLGQICLHAAFDTVQSLKKGLPGASTRASGCLGFDASDAM
ncbi:MAG: hypothetical protein ACOCTP_01325 [Roseicyclus sp.]